MSRKTILNKTHAEVIAEKLGATYKEGRDHTLAILYVNNVRIGQFGIRRGSKKDQLGHDYIPQQIFFPSGQCLKLAQCTLNRPDWVKSLQEQGIVAKPSDAPAPPRSRRR
jgi:hypothetical protein